MQMCELGQSSAGKRYGGKFAFARADTFFKDRSWLCMEFQPLSDSVQPAASLRGETTGSIPELIGNLGRSEKDM